MTLQNRREMARFLEEAMNKAYVALAEKQKLDVESSLVKCYLIEAHRLASAGHEEVLKAVRSGFREPGSSGILEGRVHETKEELFFYVDANTKKGKCALYIDATSSRFWLVHSVSKSTVLDPVIRSFLTGTRQFDSAWIPAQLLERTTLLGDLRGMGLDFDRRSVPDVDFERPGAPVEFLKMQLWGNRASEVLRVLRAKDAFPEATTLSKVKIKHWLDANGESPFSIVDIKYDGKITARGTSFQSYMTVVTSLYRTYAEAVRRFEEKFVVSVGHHDGKTSSMRGEPLNITFQPAIENLDAFCSHVFSSGNPFRIWGLPVKVGANNYRVAAVDLHVGSRLNLEISPEYMRVYLAPGACGNTLFRLYTNLQHYYHSLIEAKDGSGEQVFKFQP